MSTRWAREDILKLIMCVQQNPCLYCVKSLEYLDRNLRAQAFNDILGQMQESIPNVSLQDVKKKMRNLRTQYMHEERMVKRSKKSGRSEIYVPKLWCYNQLSFLKNQVAVKPSEDSIKAPNVPSTSRGNTNKIAVINAALLRNNIPPKKKPWKIDEPEVLIPPARKQPQEPQNDFDRIGLAWAAELQKMTPLQQMLAKKAVNDIMFVGQMGTLDRDSVQINSFSRTSTPYEMHHCDSIIQYWKTQYIELESKQKIVCRKIIADVLFHASMNELDVTHIPKVQEILLQRSDTFFTHEVNEQINTSAASSPRSSIDVHEYTMDISSHNIRQSMENLDSISYSSDETRRRKVDTSKNPLDISKFIIGPDSEHLINNKTELE